MHNANTPPASELPSSRTLAKWTAIAAGVALLLLVTVVLPAEYGVDPTGVGRVTGLQRMGEIKVALAREAAEAEGAERAAVRGGAPVSPPADMLPAAGATTATTATTATAATAATAPAAVSADVGVRTDETRVTLRPGQAAEIKLAMRKDARVRYSWSTDRGVVNFDMHADRTAAPAIKYHGYTKGQGKPSDEGELVAAFEGMHGWFWRNRGSEAVTVTLRTQGDYQELKRLE